MIFFVNFNAFTFIYEGFGVLSAAFVRILLFATCHTLALNSWHVFSVLLTFHHTRSATDFLVYISIAPRNNICVAREFLKLLSAKSL